MQLRPSYTTNTLASESPADAISRHMRWQIGLALAGILLLASLLGYSSYSVTTVLVPATGGSLSRRGGRKSAFPQPVAMRSQRR